jgi:hypothetical protein
MWPMLCLQNIWEVSPIKGWYDMKPDKSVLTGADNTFILPIDCIVSLIILILVAFQRGLKVKLNSECIIVRLDHLSEVTLDIPLCFTQICVWNNLTIRCDQPSIWILWVLFTLCHQFLFPFFFYKFAGIIFTLNRRSVDNFYIIKFFR